jgi:sec-independent protein translocase protein TatC
LLNSQKLNSFRAYWVVLELVICAFLTPSGDPFTMFLMALPLHLLYEISTAISWYWSRNEKKRLAAQENAGA